MKKNTLYSSIYYNINIIRMIFILVAININKQNIILILLKYLTLKRETSYFSFKNKMKNIHIFLNFNPKFNVKNIGKVVLITKKKVRKIVND